MSEKCYNNSSSDILTSHHFDGGKNYSHEIVSKIRRRETQHRRVLALALLAAVTTVQRRKLDKTNIKSGLAMKMFKHSKTGILGLNVYTFLDENGYKKSCFS